MSLSRREAAGVIMLAGVALVGGIFKYWRDYTTPVSILLPARYSETSSPEREAAPGDRQDTPATARRQTTDDKINLNTATREEIELLPGIGPVLAQRIIEYRRQNGSFRVTEEVMNVSGIGPERYDALRELVTLD